MASVRWLAWLGILGMWLPLAAGRGRPHQTRRPASLAGKSLRGLGGLDRWYRRALEESVHLEKPDPACPRPLRSAETGPVVSAKGGGAAGNDLEPHAGARNLVVEVRPIRPADLGPSYAWSYR